MLTTSKNCLHKNDKKFIPLCIYINNTENFDIEIIQQLFSSENKILNNTNYVTKDTPLLLYIKKCQEKKITINIPILELLKTSDNIIMADSKQFTPLHQYLINNKSPNTEIINLLLKDDQHKLIKTSLNYTPLHIYLETLAQNANGTIILILLSENRQTHLSIKSFNNENDMKKNKNGSTLLDFVKKAPQLIKLLETGQITTTQTKKKKKITNTEDEEINNFNNINNFTNSNNINQHKSYYDKYIKYKTKYLTLKKIN